MLSRHLRAAEISKKFTRSRWLALLLPLTSIGTVFFAVLILLISLSYRGLQDQLEREAEIQVLESARKHAEQISGELKSIRNLGLLLAGQVQQQLGSSPELGNSLSSMLSDIFLSHELVSQVYVNTRQGETLIYPLIDAQHEFPADAAHNPDREPVWTDVYLDPAGAGWMVSLILPVVMNDQVEAVVGLDLTLDSLMKRLMRMSVLWDGYTLLMAADGTLLTFPALVEKDWGLQLSDLSSTEFSKVNLLQREGLQKALEPLRIDASGLIPMSLNTREVLLSWSSLQGASWKLLQVTPANTVFAMKEKLADDYYNMVWLVAMFPVSFLLFLLLLAMRRDQMLAKTLLEHISDKVEAKSAVATDVETLLEPLGAPDWLQLISGPLLICRFDAETNLLACNSAFELFAGETSASLRGQKLQSLLGLKNLLHEDLPDEVELCHDQQEPVRYWVSRHITEQGDGVLLLLDVSHYAQQQQQLRIEHQRALQSARMKAEFFQVASSDAYKLLGELQQNAKTLDNASSKACHQKLIAIQRLLDDMRDMSEESDAEELRETADDRFALTQLVSECHAATESLLTVTGRQLQVVYEKNMPEQIQADRRRLSRLLKHLLRQAGQFSERGDLHLSLAWKAPNHLLLRFNDQGGGAPEADRLKQFQSSTPLDSRYEPGTRSLGQLLTRQLVQEMKGSLDIKVRVDGGLQLLIDLPAQRASEPRSQTRILVVDDGPVNSMLASSVLEKSGYLVDTASSGARALELGREKTYDLLLMDIYMPEMDGIETTQRWRQLPNANAGIPVIALTAHALDTDRERFIEQGLDDYLAKPYRPAELRKRVSHWLNLKRGDS
ncbi:MAG: response regulator [Marinospirillum sp.]|uniref:response regulator n=1 Tax=Marinospirillum sp. TaxID=2183934 RepID=UPI0019FA0FA6|nr:response regulator [Marinospirillum sp.]MBE0506478.1 response regulator [Marinospirillum sp.]